MVKNPPAMWKTLVRFLGWDYSLEKRNGYPFQYSGLENSMNRGAWQATVHGTAKSQTRQSDLHFHFSSCSGVCPEHRGT